MAGAFQPINGKQHLEVGVGHALNEVLARGAVLELGERGALLELLAVGRGLGVVQGLLECQLKEVRVCRR